MRHRKRAGPAYAHAYVIRRIWPHPCALTPALAATVAVLLFVLILVIVVDLWAK